MLGCRDEKEFRSSRTTPAREDLDSQAEPNLRRRKNKMKKTDSFDQQTSIPPLKPGRSELMLRCDRQTPIKQRDQWACRLASEVLIPKYTTRYSIAGLLQDPRNNCFVDFQHARPLGPRVHLGVQLHTARQADVTSNKVAQ
jgi:hypothetical protein